MEWRMIKELWQLVRILGVEKINYLFLYLGIGRIRAQTMKSSNGDTLFTKIFHRDK